MESDRVGSKFGGGGVANAGAQSLDRRERLRKLALETIDLAKVRGVTFSGGYLPFAGLTFRPPPWCRILIFCAITWEAWNVVCA